MTSLTLSTYIYMTYSRLNKYNNLQKRWKEVFDAVTGTEKKYFRQKEEFDLMYGTKQSSKPYFTIDSIPVISECSTSNESNEVPFTEQTTNNSKRLVKKLKNVPKREASTGSS